MFLRISITILLLLAAATGTRMFELAHFGLSDDETITLCIINGYEATGGGGLKVLADLPEHYTRDEIRAHKTYHNVLNATIRDNGNSIAYNMLLSWWTKVFGNTNYSLRFLSLVFGVLTVVLGYYFARQLFNGRTAVIAGIILCMHPLLIEYGQLARAYVPGAFFALLSTYSLYQVAVSKRHTWLHIPLYTLSVVLCLLFHYLVIYVLLSHVLLVLFFHSHKKALIKYAIMGVASSGLFSIWLFNGGLDGKKYMDAQNEAHHQRASMDEKGDTTKTILYRTALNTAKIFASEFQTLALPVWVVLGYLLLPATLLVFAFLKIRKSEYFRQGMFVLFPIVMYFAFVLFTAFRSGHTTTFDARYTTFAIPFACILLAFGLDRMLTMHIWIRRLAFASMSALFAVMLLSAFPQFFVEIKRKGGDMFPYHHASDFIEKNHERADEVVFSNDKDALLTNFYIHRNVDIKQRTDTATAVNEVQLRKSGAVVDSYIFQMH
ncbi:MAG: glycosyltransferase family 39 protein [Flavobacteriales bacterium]